MGVTAAVVGCTPDDQELPFSLEEEGAVTRTVSSSGGATISSPAGISVTLPAGSVSPGTRVTVTRLDPRDIVNGPAPFGGSAFLLAMDEAPRTDPRLTFTGVLSGSPTVAELIGAVPVVFRVGDGGAGAAGDVAASMDPRAFRAGGAGPLDLDTFLARLRQLLRERFFAGISSEGGVQDSPSSSRGFMPSLRRQITNTTGNGFDAPVNAPNGRPFVSHWTPGPDGNVFGGLPSGPALGGNSPGSGMDPDGEGFIIYVTSSFTVPLGSPYDGRQRSEQSHPIFPGEASTARFGLACIGIDVDVGVPQCDGDDIEVRGSEKLRERYQGALLALVHLLVDVELSVDGTARGTVIYEGSVRAPLASGIVGYPVSDELTLDGSWSIEGQTIRIGGHRFNFALPDEETLILGFEETVKLSDADGTETEEPVQLHLRLSRR